MCGIVGIVAPLIYDTEKLRNIAVSMADTLYHRGPDASGVWVNSTFHLALAHRRLAIQDLSPAGHQPMASPSGRFHIVFNGEIYNFQVLTEELRHLGYHFRGHSDTEVLLAALEEWGVEESLRRSCGMFAIALWDNRNNELILCRDRMGEKPLFFGWVDSSFVFASELKALKKVFPTSFTIDDGSLAAFFRFGYVPTPFSIYKNIFKMPPGSFLRIPLSPLPTADGFSPFPGECFFSPHRFWHLGSVARAGLANPLSDESEAIEQFDQLLREIISQQKISDVSIGAFLSGGIDSSLISAVMQSVSEHPIETFTIGFKEKMFDEAPYARAISEHIGSNHHEYYVSAKDGLNLIETISRIWDEPFADSSQIPSLLVAKMARRKVTVCLTGDGGDELFCGYNRYFINEMIWRHQQKIPFFLRRLIGEALVTVSPSAWQGVYRFYKRLASRKGSQANIGLKIHKLAGLLCLGSQQEAYRYLMSYWQVPNAIFSDANEAPSIFDREPNPELGGFIHDAMYWDQIGYLVDDNLVKGDRSSMAYSLETRMPLLDHRIVEFSWRLPLSIKYRNGVGKWLLRKVLNRYVPASLFERPKMGFSVPVSAWLRGPLRTWAGDLLQTDRSATVRLNRRKIDRIWVEHQKGSYDHSHKLWALCMWLSWKNYQDQ